MHCNSLMHRNRYFKLNVDGALFFNLQHTGISFILRDSKGNCIMATSVQDIASLNPKTIGTLTILRGLQQCMHMGISCLIIESDCQFVMDKLEFDDFCSDFGNLLVNIKEWIGKFIDCQIQFTYRECNKVAHTLAHHAQNVENSSMWYGVEPKFISPFAWTDKFGL